MADTSYLQWPFLADHHRRLAAMVDEWCAANLSSPVPEAEHSVEQECRQRLARLASGGWLRYVVPAAYGGVYPSIDVRALCVIREALGRYDPLADFVFAMQGLGSGAITLFGTERQRAAYLEDVACGRKIAAFALTEESSGSNVAGIETGASWDGEAFELNGSKTFISNGGIADFYVLFARTGERPGSGGLSAFIVDADATGFDTSERIEAIAPHPLATLRLNACRLGAQSLLGERGAGFAQAMATLDVFRATVGAAALGFARRALDEATRRVIGRQSLGGRLADNAMIQGMLADMAVDIDAAALLVYRAAWARDTAGVRNTREVSMAKLYATEAAQRVIDAAVQLFGGMGVVRGSTVESLYREIRALRIYEGASEIQRIVIARQHLAGFA